MSSNNAPVLSNVTSAAWPPGAPPVTLSPGTAPTPLDIGDIDSPNLAGATVKLTNSTLLGDTLAVNLATSGGFFVGTNIAAVYNAGNFTLTLSGSDTQANYEFVLQHVTFTSTNPNPTSGGGSATRTVAWQLDDGSGAGNNNLSNPQTSQIFLHTLDLDGNDSTSPGTNFSITYTEHGTPVPVADIDVVISDVDSSTMSGATVTLTNAKANDSLALSGSLPVGITSLVDTSVAGQITLRLIGADTAALQTALHQVVFSSSSGNIDVTDRDITVSVTDSLNIDTNTAHATVAIVAVNDAPVAQNGSASGNEDAAINGALIAGDVDSASLTYNRVTNAAHGTVMVNANGTFNYTPNSNYNGPDSFTFKANDGSLDSNVATINLTVNPVNDAPINTVPGTQTVGANTALAIAGLSVSDTDAGVSAITTILSVAHGSLTIASAGGAAVAGSGTASVTLTGTVAQINTTLAAANNVVYAGQHDFFGADVLTVTTNDGGHTGAGGALTDIDQVAITVGTIIAGTPGPDSFNAPVGTVRIDAGTGTDTITFGFKLVDATVNYLGNTVVIDGPGGTSHTVLTGFEVFNFTDGTVHNDDGSPLVDDLFYYAKYHDVWTAHLDADADYNGPGWHANRDPNAFFSTGIYLSANPDVKAAGVNPLTHFDTGGWIEGRVPSINFDPAQYLAANPDVAAAHIDPLRHFLQSGAGEGRQPFAPSELVTANGFDYVYYLNHNPDVAASGADAFQHFQTVGWKEGRNPNALFDTNGYLATYSDVKAANVNPLDHYNAFGWHEGRDPSVGFDTTSYLAAYADVNAAHVNPLTHFLQHGIHEGRLPFADGVWG